MPVLRLYVERGSGKIRGLLNRVARSFPGLRVSRPLIAWQSDNVVQLRLPERSAIACDLRQNAVVLPFAPRRPQLAAIEAAPARTGS